MKFDKDKLYLPYNCDEGYVVDSEGEWEESWSMDQRLFAAQACNNYHALVESLKEMIEVCYDEALPCSDKAKSLLKELGE